MHEGRRPRFALVGGAVLLGVVPVFAAWGASVAADEAARPQPVDSQQSAEAATRPDLGPPAYAVPTGSTPGRSAVVADSRWGFIQLVGDSPSRVLPDDARDLVLATLQPPTTIPIEPVSLTEPALKRAVVRAPQGLSGANLRQAASVSARSLLLIRNGVALDVLEGTATRDGFTWLRARGPDGVEGWIVSTAVAG